MDRAKTGWTFVCAGLLLGAACTSGSSTTTTTATSPLATGFTPTQLAVDGTSLYWFQGNGIYKMTPK